MRDALKQKKVRTHQKYSVIKDMKIMRKLFPDISKIILKYSLLVQNQGNKKPKSRLHAFQITRLKHTHTRNIDIQQK